MNLLLEPLEIAVRRALEFDPDTRERLGQLDGRQIELVFTGIEQRLWVTIEDRTIRFPPPPKGEPDLHLVGTPIAFARYLMAPDRLGITETGIKIEGDVGLAQRFAGIMRQLNVDWEEWASRYLGDVLAYRAGRFAERFRGWAAHGRSEFRQDTAEYLQEEIRLLAPRERVQRLLNDIDAARSDVERLAERVRRLERAS